jgi:uncharacterized membrane protein
MKKYFITRLAILLPVSVAVTFFVLGFMIDLLTAPFLKLVSHMLAKYQVFIPIFKSTEFVTFIARILIIFLFCLLILILGVLGRWFLFKVFLNGGNSILMKIPFFGAICHTAKDLINPIISMDERKVFAHPLMARFPFKKSLATYIKKLRLLAKHYQEDPERRYKVIINRIKPYNIYFELVEFFLESSIHISEIHDDFYIYDQKQMSLLGQRTKRKFSYGDEMWVKIEKIDLLLFKIKWKIEQKVSKKQTLTIRKER